MDITTILRAPQNVLPLRLQPGDLVAFHNRRVLHGRAAFNPESGPRRLYGCYVDTDELYSRIRVLERNRGGASTHADAITGDQRTDLHLSAWHDDTGRLNGACGCGEGHHLP